MSTNPSIVLQKKGLITVEDRPEPVIEDPYYVKLHIKRTGICGSDVHYYTHGSIGNFVLEQPMVLGHESSGLVVEVGSKVTRVQVGDRVAIEPGVPSRYSDETKEGRYNLCPCMAFAATPPYDGTLAKYYLMPEDFLVKLPDNVSYEEGALVEPMSVGVHAAKLAKVRFGDKVVVFGAGPVGLLAAAVAKSFGATKVCMVDVFDHKLELSKKFGATHTFNSKQYKLDDVAAAKALVAEFGEPNVVLECSGAEVCIRTAIKAIKAGGRFVQIGMGKDDILIPMNDLTNKELSVLGNFRYSFGDYRDAVELIATGMVDVKPLVTHRFSFEQSPQAYQFNVDHASEVVKTMILGVGEK